MNFSAAIKNRFPALSSRDFTIFWIGQFISLIGTWMQNVTQPYLAYRISNQPFYLGLITRHSKYGAKNHQHKKTALLICPKVIGPSLRIVACTGRRKTTCTFT